MRQPRPGPARTRASVGQWLEETPSDIITQFRDVDRELVKLHFHAAAELFLRHFLISI